MMKQSRLEFITGAIVLCVVAWTIVYLALFQPLLFGASSGYILKAQFTRVDGITEGSAVYMNGVKIGKVVKVTLDPKTYNVWLDLSIVEKILVPKDSSADIVSESLIGGKRLSITPGGSDQFLAKNGVISYTQSPLNLESVLIKAFMSSAHKKD